MDAEQTMLNNLKVNTGKSLDEWIKIVKATKLQKHGEILNCLKVEHGFTHGFANMVAHKTLKSDAGSQNEENLLVAQFKGKEHFQAIYDQLQKTISEFGADIEFLPKKAYTSVKRKKQFAMLIPSTKTRFDVGINLKGVAPEGILQADSKTNGMCSHRISLSSAEDLTTEVFDWLREAYANAG